MKLASSLAAVVALTLFNSAATADVAVGNPGKLLCQSTTDAKGIVTIAGLKPTNTDAKGIVIIAGLKPTNSLVPIAGVNRSVPLAGTSEISPGNCVSAIDPGDCPDIVDPGLDNLHNNGAFLPWHRGYIYR